MGSERVSLRSCYLALQKLWTSAQIISWRTGILDIGLENENRNKRADTHTHTAETTGFSLGTVKRKFTCQLLSPHCVWLSLNLKCTPASPDEHFRDSLLPFDLGSLSSVSQKQTYTLFIACNFSSLVNMSHVEPASLSVPLSVSLCSPFSGVLSSQAKKK